MSDSLATPWTVDRQAPLSMGPSRQEHWNGLPPPFPYSLLLPLKLVKLLKRILLENFPTFFFVPGEKKTTEDYFLYADIFKDFFRSHLILKGFTPYTDNYNDWIKPCSSGQGSSGTTMLLTKYIQLWSSLMVYILLHIHLMRNPFPSLKCHNAT